jgi:DNA-binding LacI/PurR family transcriptional regulator
VPPKSRKTAVRRRSRARGARSQSRLGDVARLARVSTATVSRVINETGYASEASRKRVLKAVQKLHYHPNAHARTLASGRSRQIGLLISDISNPFFPELVKSIERTAFQHGFEVVLSETDYRPERLARAVHRFLEHDVAGVLVMATELDPQVMEGLARRQVPLVLLDLPAAGERGSTVAVDYAKGIHEAVRHLAALGHRLLAYVGGPRHMSSAAKRRQAFLAAARAYVGGTPAPRLYDGDWRLEGGLRAGAEILHAHPRPTAVLAANDLMALGVMKACRAEHVQVPRDISIVGYDDIAFAALADPPLSTVCLPRDELGRRAMEALLQSLSGGGRRPPEVVVPT